MLFSCTGSIIDNGSTIDDGSTTDVPRNSSQQMSTVDSDSLDREQVKEHEASTSVTAPKEPGILAPTITKREKRKRKLDASELLEKFTTFQQESEKRFFAWEEKRMKMEQEEEARRREENRQHEMNLFSMLVHTLRAPNPQWQVPQRGQHSDFLDDNIYSGTSFDEE